MNKLPRQTEFILKELLDLMKKNDHGLPRCMLINEIGTILKNGEDENSAAENYLVSILDHEKDNYRAIAFTYLSSVKGVAENHSVVLNKFKTKTENEELMPLINEALAEIEFN